MIRISDVMLLALAVGGAIWTYQIKHEAELSAKNLKKLTASIRAENHKIALIEADWAIETSPARLETVAHQFKKQLKLRPMESSQIISLDELPSLRHEREENETLAGNTDGFITGGIKELLEREAN